MTRPWVALANFPTPMWVQQPGEVLHQSIKSAGQFSLSARCSGKDSHIEDQRGEKLVLIERSIVGGNSGLAVKETRKDVFFFIAPNVNFGYLNCGSREI